MFSSFLKPTNSSVLCSGGYMGMPENETSHWHHHYQQHHNHYKNHHQNHQNHHQNINKITKIIIKIIIMQPCGCQRMKQPNLKWHATKFTLSSYLYISIIIIKQSLQQYIHRQMFQLFQIDLIYTLHRHQVCLLLATLTISLGYSAVFSAQWFMIHVSLSVMFIQCAHTMHCNVQCSVHHGLLSFMMHPHTFHCL